MTILDNHLLIRLGGDGRGDDPGGDELLMGRVPHVVGRDAEHALEEAAADPAFAIKPAHVGDHHLPVRLAQAGKGRLVEADFGIGSGGAVLPGDQGDRAGRGAVAFDQGVEAAILDQPRD